MVFIKSKIAKTKVDYAINNNIQLSLDDCFSAASVEKRIIYFRWLEYFYLNYSNVIKFTVLSYNKNMFTLVAKIGLKNSIEYYYITPTKNYFYSEAYK